MLRDFAPLFMCWRDLRHIRFGPGGVKLFPGPPELLDGCRQRPYAVLRVPKAEVFPDLRPFQLPIV